MLLGAILLCGSCKSAGQAAGVAASSGPQFTGDTTMIAIAVQARASLAAATFVHEIVTPQYAGPLVINTTFANGGGATGTFESGSNVIKFVYAGGTMYLQGRRQAFEDLQVHLSPAQWNVVAGKWINVTADDGNLGPFGTFADFAPTNFPTVLEAGGTLSAAPGVTIGGKQAIGILDVRPGVGNTVTVYVSAGPDHLPLRVQPTATSTSAVDSESARVDFDDYGVAAAIVAPPSAITTSDLLAAH